MTAPVLPPRRAVMAAALVAAPAVALAAGLAAVGGLPLPLAGIAALIAVGAAAALVRSHAADLRAVAHHIARVAGPGAVPTVPERDSATARGIAQSIDRLQRAWRREHDAIAADLEAEEGILEALHDPLLLVDREHAVLRANGAARELFGERVVGRDLSASLRHPQVLEAVDAVLGGAASRTVEVTQPGPVERVFEARVKPFRPVAPEAVDAAGERPLPAAILTLHDLTAARRSEQMRADFVANASHELRTPLSSLLGFIETLRGPARDDEEARERFLAIMHEQAGRMSRLVSDLLSLSRIELDEHTPPTGRSDLPHLVRAVAATLELKARARRIRLRIEAPDDLPAALGDDDQLTQVFQNLIDNAIKYAREETEVVVSLRLADDAEAGAAVRASAMIAVAVADQGEGIARNHLPRLTERFYRVDAARSRALGGTGLGLAIVKHIVNRHRGRLTIHSEVASGSTFTVHLPVAAEVGRGRSPTRQADSTAARG